MTKQSPMIGHNSGGATVTIEVRLFNSMHTKGNPEAVKEPLEYPAGTTVGDVFRDLKLPREELFLILVNGRDISPGLVGDVRFAHELEEGDILAFSGPVPYSFGYGAPVV
ncbi:MoaD/ThiS family protein [Terasakiella sp. SH-1]|uniref:MoaD/ThiS family protein n=1 Tax=Terasakiella sp. SH-1 TaxID=2560057 RepID=UPI001073624C|nr:MoaD/ThiS family protein [Terasakiella sp. SH-1]